MKKLLVLIAVLAMMFPLAFAQKADADIYGTVLLPDGSAIPGVAVTLTGDVIGETNTVTSEEGNFRFLKLPPGNYELRFELEGFKTVIRKNIRIFAGKNITLNVPMETTTIKEEIVITEKPGAIDVRKTQVGINVTDEMIKSLPTARNPWTVMNLIPGLLIDREDVGGNESGQQSSYYGHGGSGDDSTWTLDGANITDPSAIGAAPSYLNMNAYEELQVTIGANDITAQTGGVQLNFVSKRAGNRFSGDFHLYVEDERWEMTQDLPESITDRGWVSPGIFRLYQYGVNFGGPIIKDKLWFLGSYGIQDIHSRQITGTEDATWLLSGYAKVNFQLGNTSGEFHLSHDTKMKWGRTWLGAGSQDATSYWDQDGPGWVYIGQLQQVLGNLMLNARIGYTDGGFQLMPQEGVEELDEDGHMVGLDLTNSGWFYFTGGTPYWYITNRNTINLSLDGNYFAENVLGGDHEIRFGVDYFHGDTTTTTLWPNQRWFYNSDIGLPAEEIWFYSDGIFDVGFDRYSFYLSDTVTWGKLTVSLGFRYDKETGSHNAVVAKGLTLQETGQPIFADWIPPLEAPAVDIDAAYEVISPRLSLTYDITGDGKNVVKATLARYGSQSGNYISAWTWTVGAREVDVAFNDANHNGLPDIGEWSEDPADWYYWTFNEDDPYSITSRNTYASDLNSPLLDEISVGFEKALGEDLAFSITGFYKKRHDVIWYRGQLASGLETIDNWYPAYDYTLSDGSVRTIYHRTERPGGGQMSNHGADYYDSYLAAVLTISKKFSNKWMMDASFIYSDWKAHRPMDEYHSYNANLNPTNQSYYDGGVVAPESGGSGLTGIFVNSRWAVKVNGLYQLPWGINITGVFQAREGYVIPYYERVYVPGGVSWTNVYSGNSKMGDDRLPTFWMLNLGLEKSFKVSETTTATLFVDAYNITNNAITLKVEPNMLSSSYDQILRILNPGVFQFGVRVSF